MKFFWKSVPNNRCVMSEWSVGILSREETAGRLRVTVAEDCGDRRGYEIGVFCGWLREFCSGCVDQSGSNHGSDGGGWQVRVLTGITESFSNPSSLSYSETGSSTVHSQYNRWSTGPGVSKSFEDILAPRLTNDCDDGSINLDTGTDHCSSWWSDQPAS